MTAAGLVLILAALSFACEAPYEGPNPEVRPADEGWQTLVHHEPDFHFVFPDTWKVQASSRPEARALVNSYDPATLASCNVVTIEGPFATRLMRESGALQDLNAEALIPRSQIDTVLVEAGEARLGGLPAKRVVYDGIHPTVPGKRHMRHVTVASVRPPDLYTVTCAARSEAFASLEPAFDRLLQTFAFEE